ncbi:hypothetical protein M758_12G090900 [Ceratodon purpureus]|nr:hypothetical protein M758_12G090900 [Ceratodon purpureus]
MRASLWPEVMEETLSINKQLEQVNTSILQSNFEIVACENSIGKETSSLLTPNQEYTVIELAQSSRSSLPKPDGCELCPNGRVIKLLGAQTAESPKFVRLYSEGFPDLKGSHLEVLSNICAHPSQEFFVNVATNQWVRTSITSDTGAESLCSPTLFEEDRCKLMSVHSNVLPCDSYWTQLRAMRDGASRRVHFPVSILKQAYQEQKTLMTKLCEWRECGEGCDIGQRGLPYSGDENFKRMQQLNSVCLKKEKRTIEKLLWKIEPSDVEEIRIISKAGADGDVWLVKWRGGKFARKDRTKGVWNPQSEDTELKVLERLSHPHIVYGFGESSKGELLRASLFMECVDRTLFSFAVLNGQDGASNIKRPFSRGDSLDILLQIAGAIEYMHTNGFIHGDLKPQNILMRVIEISGNVRQFLTKVADFGDARFILNDDDDFKPTAFGTTSYAAPELLKSRRNWASTFRFPSKMDVYSFGCVAYEVLTGYPIHEGGLCREEIERVVTGDLNPSHSEVWKTLINEYRYPLGLIELVESCWEWDPEKRPSFYQICVELEKLKPNVLSLEKGAPDLWKFMTKSMYAFVCILLIFFCASFVLEASRLSSAAIFVTLFLGAVMVYTVFLGGRVEVISQELN